MDSPAESVFRGVVGPPSFEIDDTLVGRIGIGRYFGAWRLESEVGFRNYNVDDLVQTQNALYQANAERETVTGMLNFFRDFNCQGRIRPYAKGGVGVSYNQSSGTVIPTAIGFIPFRNFPEEETYELAWSVGGGLGIVLTERVMLDLEYQYIELGGTNTGIDAFGASLGLGDGWAHELTMGLRVNY